MGRPKLQIDAAIVRKLAARFMSGREIATILGCDEGTLRKGYSADLAFGRECGKKRLRQKQLELALQGNVTLLIFLGKQYLGQADKATISMESEVFDPVEAYSNDPELMQEALELERKSYVASQAVVAGNAGATDLPGVAVPTPHSETRRVRDGTIEQPEGEPGDCPDTSKAR